MKPRWCLIFFFLSSLALAADRSEYTCRNVLEVLELRAYELRLATKELAKKIQEKAKGTSGRSLKGTGNQSSSPEKRQTAESTYTAHNKDIPPPSDKPPTILAHFDGPPVMYFGDRTYGNIDFDTGELVRISHTYKPWISAPSSNEIVGTLSLTEKGRERPELPIPTGWVPPGDGHVQTDGHGAFAASAPRLLMRKPGGSFVERKRSPLIYPCQ